MRVALRFVRLPVCFLAGGGAVLSSVTMGAFLEAITAIADDAA